MVEKSIQQVRDFCEAANENLRQLGDQLSKIIAIREKSIGVIGMSQAADGLKIVENLNQINAKLPGAINEVKELWQKLGGLVANYLGSIHI